MRANIDMHIGHGKLKELLADTVEDSIYWNEAQNRFQFIDDLLTKCLGWEKPHLSVEVFDDNGGRADYLLGNPTRAVLEAKRPTAHFESVAHASTKILCKIKPLTSAS